MADKTLQELQDDFNRARDALSKRILGDQSVGVTAPAHIDFCDHRHWTFKEYGRRCSCGAMMADFGD